MAITGIFLVFSSLNNSITAINYILLGFSMGYGAFSIMVCFTEILYKRSKFLNLELRIGSKIKVRVKDILGLLLGVGVDVGWWFSK